MSPKKEYSFEVIDRSEALYVNEGKTYEEISKLTGVSVAQLQRWGDKKKYDWGTKREQFKRSSLQANTEARGLAREKILEALNKQKVRYEKFFENLGEDQIDTQATYAYNNLCKTISDIQKDMDTKADLYHMAPPVMDEFVKFIKRTVKEKDAQEMVFGLIDRFFDEIKPDGV